MSSETKSWGKRPFWGMSFDFDPQWCLNEEQKDIQRRLIELCRTTIRPNAVVSDRTYEYPRKNMNALASQGLLGLVVPKSLGGLGQSHMCSAMVVETIARYGCPSTAMVYVMHTAAVATLLFRYHNNPSIQDVLRRVDKDQVIGTLVYSDPATGGHFWFPLSSRTQTTPDGRVQLLKCGSWATSAGFADFYVVQTISPNFGGDFSNLSCFLLFKNEVRANTDDWSALGMHGNQSGPLICESTVTEERLVGSYEGSLSNDEIVDPFFLLLSSCCWNGISLGAIDLARRHVTSKEHADVGLRIADYPTIQDYFGEAISGTNSKRLMVFSVAQAMDAVTKNNDWSLHADAGLAPRRQFVQWYWQLKFETAKNVNKVVDKMLHVCGGTGFKMELGIERLLRDGKAGWVMGPSNEVLRQFVGQAALFGMDSLDYWVQKPNSRLLNAELRKLENDDKMKLAQKLMREVAMNDPLVSGDKSDYQDTEFDNPFNTRPPATRGPFTDQHGVEHQPALSPNCFVPLKLLSVKPLADNQSEFQFALPQASQHTGCFPGQYVQVRVPVDKDGGTFCQRYFSPVSSVKTFGRIDLVMRFESHGELSQKFQLLKPGDLVEFRGPCGGFEYEPNSIKHLSLVASGSGATPCIQLVRDIMADPGDQTSISMLYYADRESDLMFKAELDEYAERNDRCRLFYTVSEGAEEENWKGGEGHFDKNMIIDHVPGPDTKEHQILLCGGPAMIVSVMHVLFQMGFSSQHIFVYGQFGVEQVRAVYGRNAHLSSHRLKL